MPITFAVIKERKSPPDSRVVLTPNSCKELLENYPQSSIVVESSDIRAFSNAEYSDKGLEVSSDVSKAKVMIGVKEVPIDSLIAGKSYFFFSHTIKKQPYNRKL